MKLSNCIKTTGLFFFLLSASHVCAIVPHSPTDSYNTAINDQQDEFLQDNLAAQDIYALAEQRQDILENILKKIIHSLEKIDVLLEDLALEVQNNVIRTDNKKALMQSLIESRTLIQQLKDNAFAQVNEHTLHVLLQFTHAFLQHLAKALNNGFAALPAFAMSQVRSRSIDDEITIASLYEGVTTNEKKLVQVQKVAQRAGLTWYNKQYAILDKYIIQPCQKYKIPKRLAQAAALGSFGTYLWYQSESENPLMRKILGYPPRIQGGALDINYHNGIIENSKNNESNATELPLQETLQSTTNSEQIPLSTTTPTDNTILPIPTPKPLKTLGQLDLFLIKASLSQTPLFSLSMPLLLAHFKDEMAILKKEISKKITYGINFLKGGQYRLQGDGVTRIEPTTNFNHLIGQDGAKAAGLPILKYLADPGRFARKKLIPEKGYLLYGKTRTGKSEFAKALCGEIKELVERKGGNKQEFKFFEVKTSAIIEKGIGYIMELAQQFGPCVIFIDEIDLLGLQRVGGNPAMLSDFLSCMSGVMDSDPNKLVILLAATNHPEHLDDALRERGRFGKSIHFDYPSFENRKEFLCRRLNDLSVNIELFDIEKLAYETDGCSYEDLNAMIKGALQKSKLLGVVLTQKQLELSLDEEVRNILLFGNKHITQQEKAFIATYQVGVVLAYTLLDSASIVAKTTILPVIPKLKEEHAWAKYEEKRKEQAPIEHGKTFVYKKDNTLNLKTTNNAIAEAKILLAGSIAQEVLLGNKNVNYRPQDKQTAWSLIQGLAFDTLDANALSTDQKNKLLDKAHAEFIKYEQEVRELFEKNKATLQKLSEQLQENLSLTGTEIRDIINK